MTLPAILPALLLIATPDPAALPLPVVDLTTASPSDLAAASAVLPDGSRIALHPAAPPLPAESEQDAAGAAGTQTSPADTAVTVSAGKPEHTKGDPFEHFNREMFNAHEKFDHAVLRPAALAYKDAVPKPVRSGIRNFLSNLTEPVVFINDLLQLKFGRAVKTFGRFMFNSTLGFGGVLDIAKLPGLNLPHRDNGFGDTLGYYGVKPGPYLFLPFVGPTDLRDLLGGQADGIVLPLAVGHPFDQIEYQAPKAVVSGLDQRAEADRDLKALFGSAVDPYATLRSVYLQNRAGEIRGLKRAPNAASDRLDTSLSDPLADPGAAPPKSQSSAPAATSELSDPLTDPAMSPHQP